MDDLKAIAAFDPGSLDDYIVYISMNKAVQESERLYTTTTFNINSIPDGNFKYLFRFEKTDIILLHKALRMPDRFETPDRHIISGVSGLCLLLRRFAYPNRLKELQNLFGKQYSSISKLLKVVGQFVYGNWAQLLLNFGENKWFTQTLQEEMAALIHAKGSPITNCIGFIDGTARPICRPSVYQSEVYSGHKRVHCLKFQSITLPNGIIIHLSLPYLGRRHDAFILRDTLMMDQLRLWCPKFCIYGDEGYPLREQLMRPYSNTTLTPGQQAWNSTMSKLRECVEWSFGKITQQFAFVDFKKNQKLFLQPVGKYYFIATLLTNAHTCFYGSTTSTFFDIESPNIFAYFNKND